MIKSIRLLEHYSWQCDVKLIMSRRTDKRWVNLQNENKRLESEIEDLEDALLLHKHIHHADKVGVKGLIRNELVGGSRWEHGGEGRLLTYKNTEDLKEKNDQVQLAQDQKQEKGKKKVENIKKVKSDVRNDEQKLVKVGTIQGSRSAARERRHRQQKEELKSCKRPSSGNEKSLEKVSRTSVMSKDGVSKQTATGKHEAQPELFPTDPLKIENLKHKVLQKVSANVIHRQALPEGGSAEAAQDVPQNRNVLVTSNIKSVDKTQNAKPSKDLQRKKNQSLSETKKQQGCPVKESRNAQKPVEDYLKVVTGAGNLGQSSKLTRKNSISDDPKEFITHDKSPQLRSDTSNILDKLAQANVMAEEGSLKVKGEVFTSDYSSDLDLSPDRWDELHFDGASMEKDAWLSVCKHDGSSRRKKINGRHILSDDASDTPVLGKVAVAVGRNEGSGRVITMGGNSARRRNNSFEPHCDPYVASWLEGLGLRDYSCYQVKFAEHEIDMESLKDITAEQLHQMGITAVGPVNKILRAVSTLHPASSPSMTVDDLLAAVGSSLKQSSVDSSKPPLNEKQTSLKEIGRKGDFCFSDFAGEEGKDEIKTKLKEHISRNNSHEDEDSPEPSTLIGKSGSESITSYKLQRPQSTRSLKRQVSREGKESTGGTSLDDGPKSAGSKSRKLLQRRSSSASRTQSQRERSLSSDGSAPEKPPRSASGHQKHQMDRKVNKRDSKVDGRSRAPRQSSARTGQNDTARKKVEARLSATAKRREDDELKAQEEKLKQQRLEESRKRRRDQMAAKYSEKKRPDSRCDIQSSDRSGDPVEPVDSKFDGGNVLPENPDFAIHIGTIQAVPNKWSRPNQAEENPTTENLTAREKIKNVDLMVKDLQRKSVDKQQLTLDIVRDLQKQLEDIEKTLVSKTSEEPQLPQDSSQNLSAQTQTVLEQKEVKTSFQVRTSKDSEGKQSMTQNDVEKPLKDENNDVLGDLVSPKQKSKIDKLVLNTSGSVSQVRSSRSLQPSGVASMSMSKRELLDSIRREKDDHRKQIRHLQSELTRLQHKDPVRKSEVDYRDVQFKDEDLIGEGAFSQVFRGLYQGAEVAVKRLKVPLSSQDKNYFAAEVSLLRDLRHPRVVLLIGVCTSRRLPLMVLEYLSKGNLFDLLHNSKRESLDHAEYYQIARDIAAGMVYLHNHRPSVLHLDLKSMNVLIGPGDRAKIADFGFSKLKHDADQHAAKVNKPKEQIQGSPAWMAPELLQAGEVTPKADVYSFGLILWEMLTRQVPYKGCSMFQILEQVRLNKRPVIPPSCPAELEAFISRCWDQNQARRPVFKEVLSILETLSFPPDWRALFQEAGVPREVLEDVQSTRNIISLVTSTLESSKLASLLNAAENHCPSVASEESDDTDSESENELEESSDLSDDSLESEPKNISVSEQALSSFGNEKRINVNSCQPDGVKSDKLIDQVEKLCLESLMESSDIPEVLNVSSSSNESFEDIFNNETSVTELKRTELENKPKIKDDKLRDSLKLSIPLSPESAVSRFSKFPTPRKSHEAWSCENVPSSTTPSFSQGHIPPPPAPPPPPPPPPGPSQSLTVKPNNHISNTSLKPSLQVSAQALQAKSQKLKSSKHPRKSGGRPRVNPKPIKSALFAVGASELQRQRSKLKPTQQPHPNQLEDLAMVNEKTLSSIAEILRDAMSERRFALGEDPTASCDLEHTQSDVSWSTQDD